MEFSLRNPVISKFTSFLRSIEFTVLSSYIDTNEIVPSSLPNTFRISCLPYPCFPETKIKERFDLNLRLICTRTRFHLTIRSVEFFGQCI